MLALVRCCVYFVDPDGKKMLFCTDILLDKIAIFQKKLIFCFFNSKTPVSVLFERVRWCQLTDGANSCQRWPTVPIRANGTNWLKHDMSPTMSSEQRCHLTEEVLWTTTSYENESVQRQHFSTTSPLCTWTARCPTSPWMILRIRRSARRAPVDIDGWRKVRKTIWNRHPSIFKRVSISIKSWFVM